MAGSSGIRDGAFVRFVGWDLIGEDQAYLPTLKGNVPMLKKLVLEQQGYLFLAFNTNGWIKSSAVLDFSKFQNTPDCDLYVRVDYPGWYFAQGKDSVGNDIEQINDVSTATALRETVIKKYYNDNKVAAFTTTGWVKDKVIYPLTDGPKHQSCLAGIYIRLTFPNFSYFSFMDSSENDIRQTVQYANDVPSLIRETERLQNSAGFNTNGWHKHTLDGPPPQRTTWEFKNEYEGIYYRTCWPDFIYLPGLNSYGNDIEEVRHRQLRVLLNATRRNPQAIAVTTDGTIKDHLKPEPEEHPSTGNLEGIYIKYIDPDIWENQAVDGNIQWLHGRDALLSTAMFALKGTVMIWGAWMIRDSNTREEYSRAVAEATAQILKRVEMGTITPPDGAREAHLMRENFLIGMRAKGSPEGSLVAQAIKPPGGQYDYYLNKNARSRFGKDFKDLTEAEAGEIAVDTVRGAGRARSNVTAFMGKASLLSKGVVCVCCAVSLYSVAIAPPWQVSLERQVVSWSRAIAGGWFGTGVGSLVGGPVGAILGSIVGSFLAGLGADQLATWFFGGSSSKKAVELLGSAHGQASDLVKAEMMLAGCGHYTHIMQAKHSIAYGPNVRCAIENMVKATPEGANLKYATHRRDEVLATIVWIRDGDRYVPTNSRNPADVIILFEHVKKSLP